MFEQERSSARSPAHANLTETTPVTTRPNSLREKSDDEKSNSSPEDLEDRELQRPPTHPPTIPDEQGRRELKEWDCWDKLAYSWPNWKKAMYLSSIALIQISMNFNTSVYPSAVNPLVEHFGISDQQARVGGEEQAEARRPRVRRPCRRFVIPARVARRLAGCRVA